MQIKIYKNGNKVSSVDCVFEARTITFSSPAEYISTLLNFDWHSLSIAYIHATINLDPAALPRISEDFYRQFSLLDPKLRELIYSLFFEDAAYKFFTDNLLRQNLSPEHKRRYCDLLHFDIPLTPDLKSQLNDFSANLHLLTLFPDKKYDYNYLCHTFNYVFKFTPITYPYVSFAECFNIMEKWIRDNYPNIIYAYRKSLSKLLAAKEKNEFISAIKEIKEIFADANLWETNDIFAEYLECAQLPKHATVQDLSLLFVDSFYRSLENYKDLSFRTAVANSLFSDRNLTSTNVDIYLCSNPRAFLLTSFLCCYAGSSPSDLQRAMALFMLDDLENVTLEKVKMQRNRLIKTFHPDKGSADDTNYAQRINNAYEALKNYLETK